MEWGMNFDLNKLEIKDILYQVWLKLTKWFLRKNSKCEKLNDTDNVPSEKLIWACGSDELNEVIL